MHKIVIIGGGNIGSRHLQAFGAAQQPLNIFLIDPSQASLDICKNRWEEVGGDNSQVEVFFHKGLSILPKEIDFAIISTNSEHRLEALKDLLQRSRVKNVLLEKFLFSDEAEYAEASSWIEKYKANAFVNVVRRTFESYRWIFERLGKEGNLSMRVTGNNWGMCSNSIHFIDLFCYLANDSISSCEFENADAVSILPSKREGYIELLGTLAARSTKGSQLRIDCFEGDYDKIEMRIEKGGLKIDVEEKGSEIFVKEGNETHNFAYPFQSQLTLRYFMEAIEGTPSFVSYKESAVMHLKFLEAVKNVLSYKKYDQVWKIT